MNENQLAYVSICSCGVELVEFQIIKKPTELCPLYREYTGYICNKCGVSSLLFKPTMEVKR